MKEGSFREEGREGDREGGKNGGKDTGRVGAESPYRLSAMREKKVRRG